MDGRISMSSGVLLSDYHVYDPNNPEFFKPRGNMFMVTTRPNGDDYNFAGSNIAEYPSAGINLFPGGPAAPGHGIYVIPPAGRVAYINGLRFTFNLTAKGIHNEALKDRISTDPSPIELIHNNIVICQANTLYDIALRSHEAPQEITDAFASNNYLFSQHWNLDAPGRYDGDNSEHIFGIRTNGENGIYLGASFAANELTDLHIQFSGWVVNKADFDGVKYEVIPK